MIKTDLQYLLDSIDRVFMVDFRGAPEIASSVYAAELVKTRHVLCSVLKQHTQEEATRAALERKALHGDRQRRQTAVSPGVRPQEDSPGPGRDDIGAGS